MGYGLADHAVLLRKVHTAQQVLVAWVRAQVVVSEVNLEKQHTNVVFFVGSLQSLEGEILGFSR